MTNEFHLGQYQCTRGGAYTVLFCFVLLFVALFNDGLLMIGYDLLIHIFRAPSVALRQHVAEVWYHSIKED